MYGTDSANVTLLWMPPVNARRLAHYRVELMSLETTSKQLVVNTTEINLKDIPYNQETIISVSAVNDCCAEGMKLNFSFVICKYALIHAQYYHSAISYIIYMYLFIIA